MHRYTESLFKAIQADDEESWEPMYVSDNGFKLYRQDSRAGELWWTEFTMKNAGYEPSANRVGYFLASPTGTYPLLAVNGPVSDEELHALVDSLIPAKEMYQ
jgi:hypothetical protein